MINHDTIREILLTIFQAWKAQDEQLRSDPKNETLPLLKFLESETGDPLIAQALELFANWDNDLIALAPHLGVGFWQDEDGVPQIIQGIAPPTPDGRSSYEYYYDYDLEKWVPPEDDKFAPGDD